MQAVGCPCRRLREHGGAVLVRPDDGLSRWTHRTDGVSRATRSGCFDSPSWNATWGCATACEPWTAPHRDGARPSGSRRRSCRCSWRPRASSSRLATADHPAPPRVVGRSSPARSSRRCARPRLLAADAPWLLVRACITRSMRATRVLAPGHGAPRSLCIKDGDDDQALVARYMAEPLRSRLRAARVPSPFHDQRVWLSSMPRASSMMRSLVRS